MASSHGEGDDVGDDCVERTMMLMSDIDAVLDGPKEGCTMKLVWLAFVDGKGLLSDDNKRSYVEQAIKSEVEAVCAERKARTEPQDRGAQLNQNNRYEMLKEQYEALHRENVALAIQLASVTDAWKKEIEPLQGRKLEEGPIRTSAFTAEMSARVEDQHRKTIGSFFELALVFLDDIKNGWKGQSTEEQLQFKTLIRLSLSALIKSEDNRLRPGAKNVLTLAATSSASSAAMGSAAANDTAASHSLAAMSAELDHIVFGGQTASDIARKSFLRRTANATKLRYTAEQYRVFNNPGPYSLEQFRLPDVLRDALLDLTITILVAKYFVVRSSIPSAPDAPIAPAIAWKSVFSYGLEKMESIITYKGSAGDGKGWDPTDKPMSDKEAKGLAATLPAPKALLDDLPARPWGFEKTFIQRIAGVIFRLDTVYGLSRKSEFFKQVREGQ